MIEKKYSSYLGMTAAIASEIKGLSYTQILEDVHFPDKMTFLKFISHISANTALLNTALHKLETERQHLKYECEKFLLILADVKNTKLKNITEEQAKQRLAAGKTLENDLKKLKIQFTQLDKEMTYLRDYAEDQQKRFLEKANIFLQQIRTVQDEKARLIAAYLKKQNLNIFLDNTDFIKIFNHPDIQAAYLEASRQKNTDHASLTQKLKGWFK